SATIYTSASSRFSKLSVNEAASLFARLAALLSFLLQTCTISCFASANAWPKILATFPLPRRTIFIESELYYISLLTGLFLSGLFLTGVSFTSLCRRKMDMINPMVMIMVPAQKKLMYGNSIAFITIHFFSAGGFWYTIISSELEVGLILVKRNFNPSSPTSFAKL